MNKQQQPDSSISDTFAHCLRVTSLNLLGLTVREKSVTKILMFERSTELGDSMSIEN